jgi:hypothetical protein
MDEIPPAERPLLPSTISVAVPERRRKSSSSLSQ